MTGITPRCRDCRHFAGRAPWPICLHPDLRDLVGYPRSCYIARDPRAGLCDYEGRHFEPKPPPPKSLLSRVLSWWRLW